MRKVCLGLVFFVCSAFIFTPFYPVYAKDKFVLKAATFLPQDNKDTTAWWAFVEDVNKRAEGELEIRYVGGPEAIPGFKQFEAVKNGVVDIIFACEAYYGGQVTGAAYTHLTRITPMQERENGYFDLRNDLLNKHNIHYLGRPLYGPWFHVFTNKAVSRPEDLKGQKIRVSATYEPFLKELGAVPISMPGSDIYTALERGTVDGYAWSIVGNVQSGWVEVCKYILEPRIYQMNVEALVNLDTWKKLPQHLKKLLTDCMIENEKEYSIIMKNIGEDEFKHMTNKGMEVIKFSPQDTQQYVEMAYEAGWAQIEKQNPDLAPKLKSLLTP